MKTKNFKYLGVFLAGLLVSAMAVYASTTNIETSLTNAVQYIQNVVLTDNGGSDGTIGVVLDGATQRVQATSYCSLNGTVCKTIASLLTGYTETDPIFLANSGLFYLASNPSGYITGSALNPYVLLSQTGDWNTAYGRGNHASVGYLTASALNDYVTLSMTGNRNTAYGVIQISSGNWNSFVNNSGNYCLLSGNQTITGDIIYNGNINVTGIYSVNGSGGVDYTASYTGDDSNCHTLVFKSGLLVATGTCP